MALRGTMSHHTAGGDTGRSGAVSPLQIILLVVYAAVVAFLIILPMFVDQVSDLLEPVSETVRFIIAVVSGLLIAFILITMIARKASGPAEPAEPPIPVRPAAPRFNPAQTVAAHAVAGTQTMSQPRQPVENVAPPQSVVTYPDLVEGGIFGDTYIRISPGKTLRLRSMVVEPEHLI